MISLTVSLFAVVLSQFHPLYTFLDKPKLAGAVNPEFTVTHSFGNIALSFYLHLTNTGRATGTISRVEMLLEKADNSSFRKRMPVQTYIVAPTTVNYGEAPNQLPYGPHDIAPDGRWENYVVAFEPSTKDQQNQINSLSQRIQKHLIAVRSLTPPSAQLTTPITIDDTLFEELSRYVRKNLDGFGVGEYNLLVMFWDEKSEKPFSANCYSFSVFEGDVQTLDNLMQEYRTGSGILYPIVDQTPTSFSSILRPIKDERTVERMLKDYEQL